MATKGGWQEFSRPDSTARPATTSAAPTKAQQRVRVQRTRAGKGGKMVTAITGLEIPDPEARTLLKALKAAASKALAAEFEARALRIGNAVDDAFVLGNDGAIRWLGEVVGKISGGEKPWTFTCGKRALMSWSSSSYHSSVSVGCSPPCMRI